GHATTLGRTAAKPLEAHRAPMRCGGTPTTGGMRGAASVERRGRRAGPVRDVVEVVTGHGDVAELAPGPRGLAVQGDRGARLRGEREPPCAPEVAVGRSAEDVHHDRPRLARVGVPEWEVGDGAEVLLELRGPGPLDRPVPRVVRAHRELVDEQAPVLRLEEFD